jgi:hypothetical protein
VNQAIVIHGEPGRLPSGAVEPFALDAGGRGRTQPVPRIIALLNKVVLSPLAEDVTEDELTEALRAALAARHAEGTGQAA